MKMPLRLSAVAAMLGLAWTLLGPIAAADSPPKAVIAVVGAVHTHMKWYPGTLNGNARVKYLWDPMPSGPSGAWSSSRAPRLPPASTKSFPIRKWPAL